MRCMWMLTAAFMISLSASVLAEPAKVNITNLEPDAYEVTTFKEDEEYFIDRDYTIEELPGKYRGMTGIRTANDDNGVTDKRYITFEVERRVDVFVAYDSRNDTRPAWLQTFDETGDTIEVSDKAEEHLVLMRTFEPGTVVLGGNADAYADNSNYFVLVAPSEQYDTRFTIKPETDVIALGADHTLRVDLAKRVEGPIQYQWEHNGKQLDGATERTYTIQDASLADAGNYRLLAEIDGRNYTTEAKYLHVFPESYTKVPQDHVTPENNEDLALPFIRGYIDPPEFEPGQTVRLAWRVDNADRVYIRSDGGTDIGEVAPEGSTTVTPPPGQVTTYTIEAHGLHGNVQTQRLQAVPKPGEVPFDRADFQLALQYIDHFNLRYIPDPNKLGGAADSNQMGGWSLEEMVRAIKQNLDVGSQWGASEYLVFAKNDVFEHLLDYDFEINGQNLAEAAGWKADENLRGAVRGLIEYAHARDIDLIWHTNEFHIDEAIEEVVGDVRAGSPMLWEITEKKLAEFFALYPEIDGLELTGDETTYNIESSEQGIRLGRLLSKAAGPDRKAILRLWDRIGELGTPSRADFEAMDEGRNNVWLSFKNTDGDFGWITDSGFNDDMIGQGRPDRQYVEFDAWREYGGNNVFPFYYGDVWADRMPKIVDRGVENIGVRLLWNSGFHNLVQRKWANWVNLYVLTGLAQNPNADADTLLRSYVERYYPEGSREAAFDVYKHSQAFMSTLMYPTGGKEAVDHGRLPTFEEIGQAGDLDNAYFAQVDEALVKMLEKIEKLPDAVAYKEDLWQGAWKAAAVAKGAIMMNEGTPSPRFRHGWLYADTKSWAQFRGHVLPK